MAQILDAGLDMVDPYIGAKRLIKRNENKLIFQGKEFELEGDPRSGKVEYDLSIYRRVVVVGAAKGVQRCALALEEILGDYLTGGHVIGKHGEGVICKKIGVTLAGHPTPDEYCEEGCRRIYEWICDVNEKDFIITVTGSGVSSLLTWPIEGVSIKEMHDITQMMQIKKGALTKDLNPIRVHLDRYKGGKITRLLKKGTVVHLATNDLGGSSTNPPGIRLNYHSLMKNNCFIPTIADCSTFEDAIQSFKKYGVWGKVPEHIREFLLKSDPAEETVRVSEYESMDARLFKLTPKFEMVYPAIMKKAKEFGYSPYMLAESLVAEASEAGKVLASIALNVQNLHQPVSAPCALISSGELVVTVGDETGIGGRNQEFCLAAAQLISGSEKIVIGAVDTDGTDGPGGFFSEGAPDCLGGAIVDGFTLGEAKSQGFDIIRAIKTHDTSELLWKTDCGLHISPSISVLDLRVVLIME